MIQKILPAILISFIVAITAYVARTATAEENKKVILSTVDLKADYEILGLVYYRSSDLNPKKIHDELRKQAKDLGADHVVGVTYYSNAGYLYGSGTAVKLIKKGN